MASTLNKRGIVIQAALGTLAIGGLVGVSTFHLSGSFPDALPEGSVADTENIMPPSEFRFLLGSAGIDADSLSAAGVTMNQVNTIVQDARDHLAATRGIVNLSRASMNTALQTQNASDRAIRSGTATDSQRNSMQTIQTAAFTATSNYHGAVADLRNVALTTISEDAKAKLALIRSNAKWDVPHEYRLVERSQVEWVQLRKALIAEKTATKKELPLNEDTADFLTQIRSQPDTANAITRSATTPGIIAAILASTNAG